MSETNSANGQYQIIILHLSDERKVHAVVPAFAQAGQHVGVHHIQITEPADLPDGVSLAPLLEALVDDSNLKNSS